VPPALFAHIFRSHNGPLNVELGIQMEPPVEAPFNPSLFCKKCKSFILLLSDHNESLKNEFANISRKDPIAGIEFAVSRFFVDQREAKRLVLHLSVESGHCHRCKKLLFAREFVCSCRSLTLDW
jgi:hypothetical protein